MKRGLYRLLVLLLVLSLGYAPLPGGALADGFSGVWRLYGLKFENTEEVAPLPVLAEGWTMDLKPGGEGTLLNEFVSLPLTWEKQAAQDGAGVVSVHSLADDFDLGEMRFELKEDALMPLPGGVGMAFEKSEDSGRERVNYQAAVPASLLDFAGDWVLQFAISTHYASGNQLNFMAEEMMGEGYTGEATLSVHANRVTCSVTGMAIDSLAPYYDGRSLHVYDAKQGAGYSFFMAAPDVLHLVYLVKGGEAVLVFHRLKAAGNP